MQVLQYKTYIFQDTKFKWTRSGMIRQPPACKAGALPIELPARKKLSI